MRPNETELDHKVWYRLFKVIAILISIGAFVAPWVIHKPNEMLIIDSVVSLVIWLILIYIIQNIILYVLYGKKEIDKEKK